MQIILPLKKNPCTGSTFQKYRNLGVGLAVLNISDWSSTRSDFICHCTISAAANQFVFCLLCLNTCDRWTDDKVQALLSI